MRFYTPKHLILDIKHNLTNSLFRSEFEMIKSFSTSSQLKEAFSQSVLIGREIYFLRNLHIITPLTTKLETALNKIKTIKSAGFNNLPFKPNLYNFKKLNASIFSTPAFFYNVFDINYIKRERLYTKLKYSRSPAYDIVSGGAAAFLAAFIGFLVSEKFGIELVDSGDFYTLFMYIVFIGLAFKPFNRILQFSQGLVISFFKKLKVLTFSFLPLLKMLVASL
jgi:hypothetical protein